MYRECGWRWQAKLLSLPIIRPLSEVGYRLFVRYRHLLPKKSFDNKGIECDSGTCHLPPSKQ